MAFRPFWFFYVVVYPETCSKLRLKLQASYMLCKEFHNYTESLAQIVGRFFSFLFFFLSSDYSGKFFNKIENWRWVCTFLLLYMRSVPTNIKIIDRVGLTHPRGGWKPTALGTVEHLHDEPLFTSLNHQPWLCLFVCCLTGKSTWDRNQGLIYMQSRYSTTELYHQTNSLTLWKNTKIIWEWKKNAKTGHLIKAFKFRKIKKSVLTE